MRKSFLILFSILFLSGCATPSVYKEVFQDKPIYNSKEFSVSSSVLYQAVVKTICAQNFVIENEDEGKGLILAKRYFQKGKRSIVLLLQAKIIPDEENKSTLYLNALQTTERTFVADRTRFFLWVIPLPGGGGKEVSRFKEEERIIEDKAFYHKFFDAVEKEIEERR